jgi:hypothetical protein
MTSAYLPASKSAWILLAVFASFCETLFSGALRVASGNSSGCLLACACAWALRWRARSEAAAAVPDPVLVLGLSS